MKWASRRAGIILDFYDVIQGYFYVRYMDDWVVLAPKRWRLREAIKAVNEVMDYLRVEQHPDKTFIGRIARGFDFLGFHFSATGLSLARQTVERFTERIHRLYEQGADAVRIGEYAKRWARWCEVDGGANVALRVACFHRGAARRPY